MNTFYKTRWSLLCLYTRTFTLRYISLPRPRKVVCCTGCSLKSLTTLMVGCLWHAMLLATASSTELPNVNSRAAALQHGAWAKAV